MLNVRGVWNASLFVGAPNEPPYEYWRGIW